MKQLFKLAFALTLTAAATFTSLNLTAKPLQALNCPMRFLGCQFSGYVVYDGAICCGYTCPDGSTKQGVCAIS